MSREQAVHVLPNGLAACGWSRGRGLLKACALPLHSGSGCCPGSSRCTCDMGGGIRRGVVGHIRILYVYIIAPRIPPGQAGLGTAASLWDRRLRAGPPLPYFVSWHDMACHDMSCLVISCHVMSCHCVACHDRSCHAMSRHAVSWHVMSCHVMACLGNLHIYMFNQCIWE